MMSGDLIDNSNSRNPAAILDAYPSRNNQRAQLVKRPDPVVYAPQGSKTPIKASYIRQFEQQGFMVLDNVFTSEEVDTFQMESTRLRSDTSIQKDGKTITEMGSEAVRSVFQVHESSQTFKQLVSDERLAGLARYLLNDEVYIHQSRLNFKPEFRGKEFYWHSDFETWHIEDGMPRMRALSMSITLTENIADNGPLMLTPRSHQQYVVCEGETPDNHHLSSLKRQEYGVPSDHCLSALVDQDGTATATGKPGSVIVFDCNTMHGSNGNITPYPRSNIFFVYNALSNKVGQPFCEQNPRPEHVCTRDKIKPVPTFSQVDEL